MRSNRFRTGIPSTYRVITFQLEDNIATSTPGSNILMDNNLIENVGWDADLAGGSGVTFRHNTFISSTSTQTMVTNIGNTVNGFVFNDNITGNGEYGLHCQTGDYSCFPNVFNGDMMGNTVVGPVQAYRPTCGNPYPNGNNCTDQYANLGFVDAANGNYQLGATSPFRNTASDGKDPGVDWNLLRAALGGAISSPTPTPTPTPSPSPGSGGIQIASATYGGNVGAPSGNATASIGSACDGTSSCMYGVNYLVLGDPAPNQAKDFVINWSCSGVAQAPITVPSEAGYPQHNVNLVCAAPTPTPSPTPGPVGTGINVAAAANGGVAIASSTIDPNFPASAVNDGDRTGANWGHGGGWNDGSSGAYPDWMEIDFASVSTISEIDVYTLQDDYQHGVDPSSGMTFSQYGITDFDVQYWTGSSWATIQSITGNYNVKRTIAFSPLSTSQIRIVVNNSLQSYSRIVEIEAWNSSGTGGQGGAGNVAAAANGGVALASSTIDPNFTVSAVNDGDRTGANWGHGGGWNDGSSGAYPDWVEIDFASFSTIDEIDVYTLQDDYQHGVDPSSAMTFSQYGITDFDVQYWTGSSWATIQSITGNYNVKRTINFSPLSTSKIRIVVNNSLQSYSRIVEIEAWNR